MKSWTTEKGTLWAVENGRSPPSPYSAKDDVVFVEMGLESIAELSAAMKPSDPELIRRRLQSNRRCFGLRVEGLIAAYGWVTQGNESVGELERQFNLRRDEAYIWDCRTVPDWRGRGFYSFLLSRLIHELLGVGVQQIWIGASRHNRPSIRGFVNAGFKPVVDLTYRRLLRLTMLWFRVTPAAEQHLVSAAYRIIVNDHERRFGPIAIGYMRRSA